MQIRLAEQGEDKHWDDYVNCNPKATLCHLYGWGKVIRETYGHTAYFLIAEEKNGKNANKIAGILPLVHIKSLVFGNTLVSMPFLNYGGILADDEETEKELFERAARLGHKVGASNIELRHIYPISWSDGNGMSVPEHAAAPKPMIHKVRMLLELPDTSAKLFDSFKSKLRSQIRKPQKEGLVALIGAEELLDEYYQVFSVNMRDLGSPVHSKRLFANILKEFGGRVRLGIVRYRGAAAAAGLIFCFKETVEIIWASSLKSFNHLSPNMLLYWSLLEYVTDAGYKYFDFGRSTPNEGTYKFKEQWGAKPQTLYWYEDNLGKGYKMRHEGKSFRYRQKGEAMWQAMPLFLANALGPLLRKGISL